MKCILIVFFCLYGVHNCFASEVCVHNDTVVVLLDALTPSVKGGVNSQDGTWWAEFENGRRVYGESTTISVAEGGSYTATHCKSYPGSSDVLLDDTIPANLSGEYIDENGISHKREYVYCRLTHPFRTPWVPRCGNAGAGAASCLYYVYPHHDYMMIPLLRLVGTKSAHNSK